MIVGLTGKYGSGKDTVGSILVEDFGYQRIAFADALKTVFEDIDPLVALQGSAVNYSQWLEECNGDREVAKTHPDVRRYLQVIGVAVRTQDPDFWLRVARIEHFSENHPVVVTDVRFPNEVDHIYSLGGIVMRVVRQGYTGDDHTSETALDSYILPEIRNDGTVEELRSKVHALVKSTEGLIS